MCSFQPTSSFKQVTGFHKDGLGSNHPIFQPSSLRTQKISIKEFGDFLKPCHQHYLSVYILVQS